MSEYVFPPPVLILTPPGLPGQTLAAALGQNPTAYDVPELNLEQTESTDALQRELIGFRGMQILGLMRAVAQLYGGEQTGLSVEMARRWLNSRAHLPTAHVIREIAAHIAPRRMIAPVTAAVFDRITLKQLGQSLPEAIFLRLTAHPQAYGKYLSQGPQGEAALMLTGALDETVEPALPDPQELWLAVETQLEPFLADIPAARLVHQDATELARDPHKALTNLANALDMPADDTALRAMLHPERSVFAGPGPMGAPLPGQIESFSELATSLSIPDIPALDGPVAWRPDGVRLKAEIQDRATAMGYS